VCATAVSAPKTTGGRKVIGIPVEYSAPRDDEKKALEGVAVIRQQYECPASSYGSRSISRRGIQSQVVSRLAGMSQSPRRKNIKNKKSAIDLIEKKKVGSRTCYRVPVPFDRRGKAT